MTPHHVDRRRGFPNVYNYSVSIGRVPSRSSRICCCVHFRTRNKLFQFKISKLSNCCRLPQRPNLVFTHQHQLFLYTFRFLFLSTLLQFVCDCHCPHYSHYSSEICEHHYLPLSATSFVRPPPDERAVASACPLDRSSRLQQTVTG